MTTILSNAQQDGEKVDYSPDLVPRPDITVVVHELSQLSHDGWGGMRIIGRLLDAGASVYLSEYNILADPKELFASVKVAGPCMAMMLMRHAEDHKNSD